VGNEIGGCGDGETRAVGGGYVVLSVRSAIQLTTLLRSRLPGFPSRQGRSVQHF
jgi:hypothetical protein